jgi:dihydroceramide fatty acyl 2-hydroxylase
MFESELLERYSRAHPLIPAFLYLPVVLTAVCLALMGGASAGRLVLEVGAGYLLWTVFEYWAHRLFFHLEVIGPRTARLRFLVHGVHHDYPWDEGRLVIPPGASLALCVIVFATFRAALGAESMYGPFAGFVLGYVIYDELHWYVHTHQPKTRFGRWLRREHMLHHFKDSTSRFGVSCPWLDHVFGTRGVPLGQRGKAPLTRAEPRA